MNLVSMDTQVPHLSNNNIIARQLTFTKRRRFIIAVGAICGTVAQSTQTHSLASRTREHVVCTYLVQSRNQIEAL